LDDRIPVWPPDISAVLYGRISNPDWNVPWYGTEHLALLFHIKPSYEYGRQEPLSHLRQLTAIYMCLADGKVQDSRKRAENAIKVLVESQTSLDFVSHLPLGIAAPLKEAARTCQLSPAGDWPMAAYTAIGRNDRAASANHTPDILFNDGYRSMKNYIVSRNAIPWCCRSNLALSGFVSCT
jgi:anaphase-promoting complex subunit 1